MSRPDPFFDTLGRVKEQTDANSNLSKLYIAGYRAEEMDPLGASVVYHFNSRGKVTRHQNKAGQAVVSVLDGQDRPVKVTAPEGNRVEYTYDAKHNVLSATSYPKPGSALAPVVSSFSYEPTFSKPLTSTDALGRVTTFTINAANGNLTQIAQPVVGGQTPITLFTYNARGQVLNVTDPVGKVTLNAYDAANGNLLQVNQDQGAGRLNLVTAFAYNAVGDAISTTDPRGNVTQVAYDSERRVTQTTSPAPFNLVAKTTYNADGNVIKLERQTNVAAAPWQTTLFSYSLSGKQLSVTDPSGNVTAYAYDTLDRVKQITDAENRVTKFTYDVAGRPLTEIDAMGQTAARYAYTANGKQASLKDANATVTLYSYDGLDRPARQSFTDGAFEESAYDAAGNVTSRRNRAGQITSFAYDPLNRMTSKSPAALPVVNYTYDLAGKVLTVADSAGAFTHAYDTAGRALSVTRPDAKVVAYQYDPNGNRTRITHPDGFFATYSYDNLDRMTDVKQSGTTLLARYAYDALSRRASLAFGNNVANPSRYSYAANDNLTQIVHPFKTQGQIAFAYSYNKVGQKTSATLSDDRFLFRPASAASTDYSANPLNQYTLVNTTAQVHDTNGNLTGDGVFTYGYDSENRLTSATKSGTTASYAYDPLGRRKAKTVNTVTTSYLHDGDHEIAEYDGAGALLRRYVFGNGVDQPLAQITRTGSKFYYRQDGTNSIVAHEEHASSFVQRFAYGPYGEATTATGHPFRYTGRRLDEETGLYYYRARMYAPTTGRFLQTDPIGYAGGLNLYAYVGNDPLNFTDPSGECPTCVIGAAAGFGVEIFFQAYSGELQNAISSAYNGDYDALGRSVAKIGVSTGAGALSGGISSASRVIAQAGVRTAVGYGAAATVGAGGGGAKAAIDGGDIGTGALFGGIGGTAGRAAGQATEAAISRFAPGAAQYIGTAVQTGIVSVETKLISGVVQRGLNPFDSSNGQAIKSRK